MKKILEQTIYTEALYCIPPSITIVIDQQWSELLSPHQELLNKILKSVNLRMEGVKIVFQKEFDITKWTDCSKQIIAFMLPNIKRPTYQPILIEASEVIFSDPLPVLINDEKAKRKLWLALKLFFTNNNIS